MIGGTSLQHPAKCYFFDIQFLVADPVCQVFTILFHFHIIGRSEKFLNNKRIICMTMFDIINR